MKTIQNVYRVISSEIEQVEIFPTCKSIYNDTYQKHSCFMLVHVHIVEISYLANNAFILTRGRDLLLIYGGYNIEDRILRIEYIYIIY